MKPVLTNDGDELTDAEPDGLAADGDGDKLGELADTDKLIEADGDGLTLADADGLAADGDGDRLGDAADNDGEDDGDAALGLELSDGLTDNDELGLGLVLRLALRAVKLGLILIDGENGDIDGLSEIEGLESGDNEAIVDAVLLRLVTLTTPSLARFAI